MKDEYKDIVEYDITYCPNQHGIHRCIGVAFSPNKVIHTSSDGKQYIAKKNDAKIVHSVWQHIRTGAEEYEERF